MPKTAAELAAALGGRQNGAGWLARCPAHDDRKASLSISDGNGRVLVHCHAGCTQEAVLKTLRTRSLGPSSTTAPASQRLPRRPADRTWDYTDAAGVVVRRTARWDLAAGDKIIRPQLPNGRGGWRIGEMRGPRPLYRLSELIARPDAPVLVVEGEKTADAARQLFPECVVVTSPGGSNAAGKADWLPLCRRCVTVWPDADPPGGGYAAEVVRLAGAAGATDVRVVTLPLEFPAHWDLADPLPEGWTPGRLRELLERAAQSTEPVAAEDGPRVFTLAEYLQVKFPTREQIIEPIFPRQGLGMIHAWRGLGKTYLALAMALAAAAGKPLLKWRVARPWKVLFVDGEMPGALLQERLAKLGRVVAADLDPVFFRIVTPDVQSHGIPDLGTPLGQCWLDSIVGDAELLMLDNLSSLVRSGSENADELWLPMATWILRHRAMGRAVCMVHHDGKGDKQRGISRREDLLDTVLQLRKPNDYQESDGARFTVSYPKHRDFHGKDAEPFEARLVGDEGGGLVWTVSEVDDARTRQVAEMLTDGQTVTQISKALSIGRATVDRHKRKAIEIGIYDE